MRTKLFTTALATILALGMFAVLPRPAGASSIYTNDPIALLASHTNSSITIRWKVPPYGVALVGVFEVTATALDGSGASTSEITIQRWYRSYTFAGLASGTKYHVSLLSLMGHSSPVLDWTVTTSGPTTSFRAPVITSVTPSASSVTFTWSRPTNSTSNPTQYFQVEANPVGGLSQGAATQWYTLSPSATSYTLTKLTPGVVYDLHLNTVAGDYMAIAQIRQFTTPTSGTSYTSPTTTLPTPPAYTTPGSSTPSSPNSPALSPPTSASLSPLSIGLNTAEVSWSSPGSVGVRRVELYTFKGSTCQVGAHSFSIGYTPSNNVTSGYVTSTGANFYAPSGQYSAYVIVQNAAGQVTSACSVIGVS